MIRATASTHWVRAEVDGVIYLGAFTREAADAIAAHTALVLHAIAHQRLRRVA